ncbi:MAG: hypothetical protein K2J01_05970 [Clostridiales bacterium]|nr:hypothetical protein [Clostridiales bacterium]
MLDFSKIFNIVFASVCAALLLLFLVSVIVVAAKGKRKCGVGDVLLRILATLVLIVSAAMLACAVLTWGKFDVAILVVEDGSSAAFVIGQSVTELPLPELFAALSSMIGFMFAAVLFMLSLTALIVDCLVANKKTDKKDKKKKKEPAVKKSPEQLKREAELERIRRIGESAVRKTERVAEKAEKTEKTEKTDKQENTNDEVVEDSIPTEQPQEDEPATDWRTQPAEEQHSFVGLKNDNADDSFDSFDTFDDGEAVADETVEGDGADEYEQAEQSAEEVVEEADEYAEQPAESDEYVEQADEYATENVDEFTEENGEYTEEQAEGDDPPTEDIYYDDDEGYTYDDGTQGEEGYDQAELDETADSAYEGGEEQPDEYAEGDEQPADEFDELADEQSPDDQPIDIGEEVERILETPTDDIEPDRDIYIPEIRTVTPRPTEDKPAAAQKPVTKKPAAAKRPATKPAKPRKSGDGGASQRPVIPPEKKLPVTRRYVILDRHNAVNMFGEYLKERNQAEKDKLKSSINTIIIE